MNTSTTDKDQKSLNNRQKIKKIIIIGGLTAVLLIIAIFGAGFFVRAQLQLKSQKQPQVQVYRSEFKSLNDKVIGQQKMIDNLQKDFQEMQQITQKEADVNLLTQVYDLVRFANMLLIAEHNVKEARRLLSIANNLLSIKDAPQFAGVKSVLASDMADLQQQPESDSAKVLLRLDNLKAAISELKLNAKTIAELNDKYLDGNTNLSNSTEVESAWQRVKYALVKAFTNVVHTDKQQAAPFLPPKQLNNLLVNLQSEVTLVQWAVIHGQQPIYLSGLQSIAKWLKAYFPVTDERVAKVLQEANVLMAVDIPTAINVHNSLTVIQQVLHTMTNKN